MHVRASEVPAVDEEELVAESLSGTVRLAHIALETHQGSLGADIHHVSRDVVPQEVQNPELDSLGLSQHEDILAVVDEAERDSGAGDRDSCEFFDYVLEFHVVGFQEFPSCRNVVEEIPDRDVGSLGYRGLFCRDVLRCRETDFASGFLSFFPGLQGDLRNGGYRSQGFSSETEGHYPFEVFRCGYLGCCVALEAEHGLVRIHAASVVYHLYESPAGIGDHHADLVGSGIHGILNKLLDHRRRSLHDFSCGDHVGYVAGKDTDFHSLAEEQFKILREVDQDAGKTEQADYSDQSGRSVCRRSPSGIVPVSQGAADVVSRLVLSLFLLLFETSVHVAESLTALLLVLVIIDGTIIESSVFLFPRKCKKTHSG